MFSSKLVSAGWLLGCLAILGCEIRPKPFVHVVEYRSTTSCAGGSAHGSWNRLEEEAKFAALVNCLLAGATVLEIQEERHRDRAALPHVVAPVPPRYGYERQPVPYRDTTACPDEGGCSSVASRHDRPVTWATCGTSPLSDAELRGGEDLAHADRITDSVALTGTLAQAKDDYKPAEGLDGPDQTYRFVLTERTRIEAAVAANRAMWSGVVGLVQSAWQPALYLLSSDGTQLQRGYVLRAGVTALFPSELGPGTYFLIVDSSVQEWKTGRWAVSSIPGIQSGAVGATARSLHSHYSRSLCRPIGRGPSCGRELCPWGSRPDSPQCLSLRSC